MEPGTPSDESSTPSGGSSTGLDENLAGLLTYLLGFLTGIVFLIIEKQSSYVRFHAMQSTLTFIGLFVLQIVVGHIPVIGMIMNMLLPLAILVLWIVLMVKAYQGERFKLPLVGDMAEERSGV